MNIVVKAFAYDNNDDSVVKGTAGAVFDGLFKVTRFSIVEGRNGLFVNMPNQKLKEPDEDGTMYHDTAYPLTKELREQLSAAILESYKTGEEVGITVKSRVSVKEKVEEKRQFERPITVTMGEVR